jgi:hypothetical protein
MALMELQQKYETVIGSLVSSLIVVFLLMTNMSIARAETISDFASDVQKGLRRGAQSSVVTNIKAQDYKTSWDEFGTNILVDGASMPAEIQKSLTEDIISSLQTELTYNQKDEQYLLLRHSSPEEIQALEGDGSGDLLPDNYIEPNPSLDANPDVNPSALDTLASTVDISAIPLAPDVESTSNTEPIIPDVLVPPDGEWNPSEINVFEAILNTENQNTNTSSEPSPNALPSASPSGAETPPPADAPTN